MCQILDSDVHRYHWYCLYDEIVGKACAIVRVGCSWIDITLINLFDQNVGMACAKVRLRCSCILLLLIYLITMWVWHMPKLNSYVHAYYLY